ncbi:DUF1015 domain-containing protein [Anaeroselena agilis]|uniref:DUF1015 family protein n=1 Tax=Anaeroselena agilis TaxID=3063788 RepID=A0ABU3P3D6_9FIRM|nr:DUF1015 family protein [Selenomonadales bacterium 4137-cl]
MATVKPFRGLRPDPGLAAKIAALPYDVMDSEEARRITADNPLSFLRVTKSEVDLPAEADHYSPAVYDQARATLESFVAQGYLRQDGAPCYYVYKQTMGDHTQVGLVAAASVDEYEQGIIKKHEFTRPDKELDRVNHIAATDAQTGAVFLTYRADRGIDALVERCRRRTPAYDFTADDGISHTLYVVDDAGDIAAIEEAFRQIPALYIADGHHRSAAAARVREKCRAANPGHTGEEDYNRFLVVIFPHDQVRIMDYNRVVADLAGFAPTDFLAAVAGKFTVEEHPAGACKPDAAHTFGMYLAGRWYRLTARPGSFDGTDPVAGLDVSILQDNLLAPLLKVGDPRTDKRINFVGGIRGMAELERLVDSGRYAVAFSLYPTSVEELMAIADRGAIMPPKSTWFEPKLRDAMVVHLTGCR